MEQKKREEHLPFPLNHFSMATMPVPEEGGAWTCFDATESDFFGFSARYSDEQTKIEKIRTTQYMPTQNKSGCREPIMSWRLGLFMDKILDGLDNG